MKCSLPSAWFAIGLLLCTLAVFATAWPALKNPRLEADDYRYLHHIQQWQAGKMGPIEAMTVENRRDHLWFMQEILRVVLDAPDLLADVLTMMPGQNGTQWNPGDPPPLMGAGVQVRRISDRELVLSGRASTLIQEPGLKFLLKNRVAVFVFFMAQKPAGVRE